MLITFLVVYVVGLFLVGIPFARKSVKLVYFTERVNWGVWGYLLFPVSMISREKLHIYDSVILSMEIVQEENINIDHFCHYIGLNMLIWPMRLAWSTFALCTIGVLALLGIWAAKLFARVLRPAAHL
jgi:hypothetical protein